jgi:hypothetical protein
MESELNEDEIMVLKKIYENQNVKKPKYLRKYYDLFVNNKIFIPNEAKLSSNSDLKGSNSDLKGSNSDLKGSNSDLKGSNSDLKGVQSIGSDDKQGEEKLRERIGEEYYYLGCYYNDHMYPSSKAEMMIKYFTNAYNYGNINAMISLYCINECISYDNPDNIKYLLMAVGKGSVRALQCLGSYYFDHFNIKKACYYYLSYIQYKPKKIHNILDYIIENYFNDDTFTDDDTLEPIYNMIDNIINLICTSSIKPDELVCLISGVFKILNQPVIPNDKGNIKNLDKLLIYIYKIINGKNKKLKSNAETIKQISEIVNKYEIKINAIKIMKMKYEEYLDKKYKPGGGGYFKAKKDFEKRSNNEKGKQKIDNKK